MGPSQLTLLRLIDEQQVMDRFPVGGFSVPMTEGALITESAASGTALSTGVATQRGRLSLTPDGKRIETLLERARARGRATGIVATSSVTHATPAAFVAHTESRGEQYRIAEQIAASGTDVIIGGGKKYFLPCERSGGREDIDLTVMMAENGYEVALLDAETDDVQLPPGDTGRKLLLLAADDGLPHAGDRTISLAQMTRLALERLSHHPDGFVLMVEGSQIDWACHDNEMETLKEELLDFSRAVQQGLAFALRDRQTTVIVTADHETGGLSLIGNDDDVTGIEGRWASGSHTASMVPVLAIGPGSSAFGGIHRNTEIGQMLHALLNSALPAEPGQ